MEKKKKSSPHSQGKSKTGIPKKGIIVKKEKEQVVITNTMIDAVITARGSARTLINEFVGVTMLSTVAGFVDTAGFFALFGLFTAHVTGDLIIAAAALSEKIATASFIKLLMIPIFMMTVALTTILLRSIKKRGAQSLPPLLTIMTFVLALFCVSGIWLGPTAVDEDSWAVAIIGGLGVMAMGIQNAMMRGALKSFSQTTVMTGNLAQFTIDCVDFLFPPRFENKADKKRAREKIGIRMRKSGLPLLGFMIGAASGALLTKLYGFISIAIPAFIIALLAVITWFRSRKV